MSKELDDLYKKLYKKQSDLTHSRFKKQYDKLMFDIQTIEIEIEAQKKKEGLLEKTKEPPF